MSAINRIPRGLRVLIVVTVLAVLVWRFTANTDYYYYGIGIAVLIAFGIILLIYHAPGSRSRYVINKGINLGISNEPYIKSSKNGPVIKDMAIKTFLPRDENDNLNSADIVTPQNSYKSADPNLIQPQDTGTPAARAEADKQSNAHTGPVEAPTPLIEDKSNLTEDDINELINAVWCRCENPFCKYTNFLTVHHIVDEKFGGTSELGNLIVLCPYCHDLAHKNEIPEKEMRNWISNREERFKFKPQWHYP